MGPAYDVVSLRELPAWRRLLRARAAHVRAVGVELGYVAAGPEEELGSGSVGAFVSSI